MTLTPRALPLLLSIAAASSAADLGLARAAGDRPSVIARTRGPLAALVAQVPLVRDPDAVAVYVDHNLLDPENEVLDFYQLAKRLEKYALTNPNGESPTHTGWATWYSVPGIGVQRGDGRTVTVDWQPELGDVQVHGVATPATPDGLQGTPGQKLLEEAAVNTLFGLYRRKNGGNPYHTLGLFDHGTWGVDALEVRAGHFERFAHLYQLREQPTAQRALLELVNDKIVHEYQLSARLPYHELFETLLTLRAKDLATEFFNRIAHGALTYDNNGLLRTIDFDRSSTVDRTPQHFAHGPSAYIGFGQEAYFVMKRLMVAELTQLMVDAAATDAERERIADYRSPAGSRGDAGKLTGEIVAERLLYGFMGERMLEQLGFDADVAAKVIEQQPEATARLLDELLVLGMVEAAGSRPLPGTARQVARPANYDIFRAMAELVGIHTFERTPAAKAKALLAALAPHEERDVKRATRLLERAAPVIDAALAGTNSEQRKALAELIAEEARRINRPVPMMFRDNTERFVDQAIRQRKTADAGQPLDAPANFNARLHAYARDNVRRGPEAPLGVAHALRHEQLPVTKDGQQVLLSSLRENSVLIQELAGAQDVLSVTVQRPSHVGQTGWLDGLRLEVAVSKNDTADPKHDGSAADDGWHPAAGTVETFGATERGGERAVFTVPLAEGGKQRYRFRFVDAAGRQRLLVRAALEPHLSQSRLVAAEVARWAEDHGVGRKVARPTDVEALRALPRAAEKAAPHPRSREVVDPFRAGVRQRRVQW